MKIIKILEKIKKLDITIEEIVTIKLMNNLSNLFKIYFTILSQKIGDNNKLPDLQALLPNFEDEKRCIKRITKANLT